MEPVPMAPAGLEEAVNAHHPETIPWPMSLPMFMHGVMWWVSPCTPLSPSPPPQGAVRGAVAVMRRAPCVCVVRGACGGVRGGAVGCGVRGGAVAVG
eukprot:scaffold12959_cov116-Isochrysis_galbana.AAC.16